MWWRRRPIEHRREQGDSATLRQIDYTPCAAASAAAPKLIGPSASHWPRATWRLTGIGTFVEVGDLAWPNRRGGTAACLIPPLVVEDRFVMPCALAAAEGLAGSARASFVTRGRMRPDLRRRYRAGAGGTTLAGLGSFSATDGARLSFVAFRSFVFARSVSTAATSLRTATGALNFGTEGSNWSSISESEPADRRTGARLSWAAEWPPRQHRRLRRIRMPMPRGFVHPLFGFGDVDRNGGAREYASAKLSSDSTCPCAAACRHSQIDSCC